MKKKWNVLLIGLLVVFLSGCGIVSTVKKEDTNSDKKPSTQNEQQKPTPTPSPETPVVDHSNDMRSFLTGEWVTKEIGNQRPLAIMIANTTVVCPQSSIDQAKILYEVPVEGGITRFLAVFENYSALEKIGSVRSCRYYYVYLAHEWNAIYAHYGQSQYADQLLKNPLVNRISGFDSDTQGIVFFRTSDKKAPHNAFAKGSGIIPYAQKKGFAVTHPEGYEGTFKFTDDSNPVMLSNGSTANKVVSGFVISDSYFQYDLATQQYLRFQYNQPHTDAISGKQLSFKNILVQFTQIGYLNDNKSLKIDLTGSGKGYYITNQKAIEVKWTKKEEFGITHYYDLAGNEIQLNQGKTCILIIDQNRKGKFQILE